MLLKDTHSKTIFITDERTYFSSIFINKHYDNSGCVEEENESVANMAIRIRSTDTRYNPKQQAMSGLPFLSRDSNSVKLNVKSKILNINYKECFI